MNLFTVAQLRIAWAMPSALLQELPLKVHAKNSLWMTWIRTKSKFVYNFSQSIDSRLSRCCSWTLWNSKGCSMCRHRGSSTFDKLVKGWTTGNENPKINLNFCLFTNANVMDTGFFNIWDKVLKFIFISNHKVPLTKFYCKKVQQFL